MQKLKAERTTYLEFQKVQRELDHLTKVYLAYQFLCAEETAKDSAKNLDDVNSKVLAIKGSIKGEIMGSLSGISNIKIFPRKNRRR